MRAWLCAVTIRSVRSAISQAATSFGSACTLTSTPAARAAAASRSSGSATTTPAISTPCCRSMFSVVTPKWREPTRVIRMAVLSVSREATSSVDNTSQVSVTPPVYGAAGYQQDAAQPNPRGEGSPAPVEQGIKAVPRCSVCHKSSVKKRSISKWQLSKRGETHVRQDRRAAADHTGAGKDLRGRRTLQLRVHAFHHRRHLVSPRSSEGLLLLAGPACGCHRQQGTAAAAHAGLP